MSPTTPREPDDEGPESSPGAPTDREPRDHPGGPGHELPTELRVELVRLRADLLEEIGHVAAVVRAESARVRRELAVDRERAVDRLATTGGGVPPRVLGAILAVQVGVAVALAAVVALLA